MYEMSSKTILSENDGTPGTLLYYSTISGIHILEFLRQYRATEYLTIYKDASVIVEDINLDLSVWLSGYKRTYVHNDDLVQLNRAMSPLPGQVIIYDRK
jgi:hypothetical protein